MIKVKQNLRNVVVIAICLAGLTFFSGCDKNSNPDVTVEESWIEFAGEKYYYFHTRQLIHTYEESYDRSIHPNYVGTAKPHGWGFMFVAGISSTDMGSMTNLMLSGFETDTKNPNGSYRLISDVSEWDRSWQNGDYNICGPGCFLISTVLFNGVPTSTTYNIVSGTLTVSKSDNIWTISVYGEGKDDRENTRPVAFTYRGELTLGYGSDPI